MSRFYKLSGAGNDFIALVEPPSPPSQRQIVARCHRGVSEGADGLFLLERRRDGARMRYFNCDGRPAALCINGTRCAARLAFELGWADETIAVETDAGIFAARACGHDEVEIEVVAPTAEPTERQLEAAGERFAAWSIEVGVPHLVVPWEGDIADAPVASAGPHLRRHPALGPEGANVDFVRYGSPHRIEVRSFERGVEAETLACGTGVLATVAVGLARRLAELPVEAATRGGFVLRLAVGDGADRWRMRGDARLVAHGELTAGADRLPEPSGW